MGLTMTERDPAEARLWLMTLARLAGIGIVGLGMWVAGESAGDMPRVFAGLALMAAGAATTLFAPKWLRKRWGE